MWQEQVAEQRENLKEVIEEGRRKKKERKKQLRQKLSSTKGNDERDIDPPIKEDNDSEEGEKGTQEPTFPGEMLVESRIGDVTGEGKNDTMEGEEDIERRLCALDEQGVEGESVLKGKEGTSKNVGSGNQPDGHDQRRMEDEEAKGNDILEGPDRETIRKACGAFRLHEDESNEPRTKSSSNHDDGIGVTDSEERQCTNAELKRKKSPTECESEAVLLPPRVVNECFADEENDEDGKGRLIEEEEDTVKEDGCSVQLCTGIMIILISHTYDSQIDPSKGIHQSH